MQDKLQSSQQKYEKFNPLKTYDLNRNKVGL